MLFAGLLLVALVASCATSIVFVALRVGIGPMPSSRRAAAAILSLLPPDLEGEIHELGSGWGGLALAVARAHPRCTVVAVESSPVPHLVTRLRAGWSRAGNLRAVRGDFMKRPLGEASAVVCYLFTGGMARLRPKLEAELPAGAVVVSHTFSVPGWQPAATRKAADLWHSPVYLYRR